MLRLFVMPVLFVTAITGIAAADGQENGERQILLQQEESLAGRIDALKRRQEYLLFLKTMSSIDSKYLVLTVSNGTGLLKYKNRVLRQFRFSPPRAHLRPPEGATRLMKKNQLPGRRGELDFGTDLVIRPNGLKGRPGESSPAISFKKKDFKAVSAALEEGALVYILP